MPKRLVTIGMLLSPTSNSIYRSCARLSAMMGS
jgi:hypothetical protein